MVDRATNGIAPAEMPDFSRLKHHSRVALLFSGGKDSRALIELFRPYLHSIRVYHCDTGDMFPETREYVSKVASTVPNFVRIETDAPAWIAANAVPSDLAPLDRSPLFAALTGGRPVVHTIECCFKRPSSPRPATRPKARYPWVGI